MCPDLIPYTDQFNPTCSSCLKTRLPDESTSESILRCTRAYKPADAANCRLQEGGEAGATLISRYPFVTTDYREFTPPGAGVVNWGVTYGQVQTPLGRAHLFCSAMATSASNLSSGIAQPLNLAQSQEVLNYVQSKANGEVAIFLANTGSGPAIASSPTGPALAQWPANFTLLQGTLTDALLANVDANSAAAPVGACTTQCGSLTDAGYVDHVMGTGSATVGTAGSKADLCYQNGSTFFTTPTVATSNGNVLLSDHFGVATDVTIKRVATTLTTGASVIPTGRAATLSARLTDNAARPLSSRGVALTIGSGAASQSCTGQTDANGRAQCTIATVNQPLGMIALKADFAGDGLYLPSNLTASITVLNLQISWANPAPIAFGSALGSRQLNAAANLPGTFVYTPAAGAVLPTGNGQTLSTTFSPADSVNYSPVTRTALIDVTPSSSAAVNLVTTPVLRRDSATGDIVATITIANAGTTAAANVSLTRAAIGATAAATALPVAIGTIAGNSLVQATVRFPAQAGAAGAMAALSIGGAYTGGTFNSTARLALP